MFEALKQWAQKIRRDVLALWIAARDPRTPWYAKVIAVLVAGYALSPIDLIPDFIPVIGYLDDAIIVPLGIMAAVHLIPAHLMEEFRAEADRRVNHPKSRIGAGIIIFLWILLALLVGRTLWQRSHR